jgi:hypothetical protein
MSRLERSSGVRYPGRMKIVSKLPNLFDQYSVPENRVTNALLQTLASSDRLLVSFLRQFLPPDSWGGFRQVEVHAQTQPEGKAEFVLAQSKGIPDGWFVFGDGSLEHQLDTTGFARLRKGRTLVKPNPELFDLFVAALRTCAGNRRINAEFNLITRFWYRSTPEARTEEFRHTMVDALAAFSGLYGFLGGQ